jgi:hypothetical protein
MCLCNEVIIVNFEAINQDEFVNFYQKNKSLSTERSDPKMGETEYIGCVKFYKLWST